MFVNSIWNTTLTKVVSVDAASILAVTLIQNGFNVLCSLELKVFKLLLRWNQNGEIYMYTPVLQIRRGNRDNLGIISHISP